MNPKRGYIVRILAGNGKEPRVKCWKTMEERDFSIVAICGQESVRKVLPRTLLQGGDWRETENFVFATSHGFLEAINY